MFNKKSIATICAVFLIAGIFAAIGFWTNNVSGKSFVSAAGEDLWQEFNDTWHLAKGKRQIVPEKYRSLGLNKSLLESILKQAPNENESGAIESEVVISLPLPDGKFSRFRVVRSTIMEPELQAEFPEIQTFSGQGLDDATATTRFDVTPQGFHAIILNTAGSIYIDPYSANDTDNYISYNKNDYVKEDRSFVCLTSNDAPNALDKKYFDDKAAEFPNLVNNAGTLRTYRLAMAATGEYTTFHGGTVTLGMAAITTTMNRVNALYERELSVRMILIANNTSIVYTTAATDPYANDDTDLTANQTNINAVVGTANYDIGHLVGTGGGGIAQLRSPCGTGKARGLTGLPAPVGDPFDIDFVAHEMGHQFGGNHTFNSTQGNCAARATSAAFETGSGNTIQAYAGICGVQDLQRNSDDYFHIRSLEEMTTFIGGTTCDVETANVNTAPVVTANPNCTVPQDTPFELTGVGTDSNGDSLTYDWEEYDLGASTVAIPNTDAVAVMPVFRSYKPRASPTRIFPSLPFILNNANVPPATFTGTNSVGTVCAFGNCLTGELLPTVNRTMNFQFTVRDNRAGGGGIRSAQTAVTVVETSGATTFGPFAVTSLNTAAVLRGNTPQTITWNEANTTAAPISCANVDISASLDGGNTFSNLVAGTPNDGTQSVILPITGTTTGRIKVKCSTSCFFDISNANFTILAPTASGSSITGRVTAVNGRSIPNAYLQITGGNLGEAKYVRTNQFGYYRFNELESGQTYILSITSKRYLFPNPTRVISLDEDLTDENFVGTGR
jgi:Metallo-peptidase family M12B Reprolysin-like/Carboxypeptidase regulatory-like domain